MLNKIYKLIEILDSPIVEKLIYLDRLVRFYSKFLTMWRTGGVTSDGREVRVKFMTVTRSGYDGFTERVFPIEDIDLRINSYRKKIVVEFAKRNENPRIIRAKEVQKWKIYINQCQNSDVPIVSA